MERMEPKEFAHQVCALLLCGRNASALDRAANEMFFMVCPWWC